MRRGTELGWVLVCVAAASACHKAPPATVAGVTDRSGSVPPPFCRQVEDHINAYLTYVGCVQPEGWLGYAPAVARREEGVPHPGYSNCSPPGAAAAIARGEREWFECCDFGNEVGKLPYRAEAVDDAVYAVMREQLQGQGTLNLRSSIWAVVVASFTAGEHGQGQGSEEGRIRSQGRLRDLFWDVPWLAGSLVDKVVERLGSTENCLAERKRTVDASVLPEVIEAMRRGNPEPACPAVAHGLYGLLEGGVDPNIAVAIAQIQRGNRSLVPKEKDILAMLERMDVSVAAPAGVSAAAEGDSAE